MGRSLRHLLILGCLVGSATSAVGPEQSWDSLIWRLRCSNQIEASLIGFGHMPSELFGGYQSIIERGDRERFHAMLEDRHPVIRCVGLLALAQTDGRDALPTLRDHLADRALVRYQAYDIISWRVVGEFARQVIVDANCLVVGRSHVQKPLLSNRELVRLDLEILCEDSTTALHGSAAGTIVPWIEGGHLPDHLAALRDCAPSLKDYQIIKAVGRMKQSKYQQDFLRDPPWKDHG